jgi:hypothetical protein
VIEADVPTRREWRQGQPDDTGGHRRMEAAERRGVDLATAPIR